MTTALTADRRTRNRRRLQLARTVAGGSLRTALVPTNSAARRQRIELCRAARTLTALGVRVEVVPPPVPWPRAGRYIRSDHTGWLGDLAVVTAALARSSAPGEAVICPVAVRYRGEAGHLDPAEVPRTVADIVATRGLVVEVRCLPAVAPS